MRSEPVAVAEPPSHPVHRRPATTDCGLPRLVRSAWSRGGALFALGIVVVLLTALVTLATAGDGEKWREAIGRIDAGLLSVMLGLTLTSFGIRALRFHWFARSIGINLPMSWTVLCYFAGFSLSATPGKIGEFMRLWLIRRRFGHGLDRTMPLQIADRLNDAVASVVLCGIGASAFAGYRTVLVFGAVLVTLGIVLVARPLLLLAVIGLTYRAVGATPRLFARLRRMVRMTSSLFAPRVLLPSILMSLAGWGLECTAFAIGIAAVAGVFDLLRAMFILEFSMVLGFASFLPGGTGMTELSLSGLLVASGIGLEDAVAATVLIRAATLWVSILVGIAATMVIARLDRA